MAIDPVMVRRFEKVEQVAKLRNIKLVEALNQFRMLVTDEYVRATREEIITQLYRDLEAQGPAKILQFFTGRTNGSPDDMFRAILEWLEIYLRNPKVEVES